jgi:hypothetical protein
MPINSGVRRQAVAYWPPHQLRQRKANQKSGDRQFGITVQLRGHHRHGRQINIGGERSEGHQAA